MKAIDFYFKYAMLRTWTRRADQLPELARLTVEASLYEAMDIIGQTAVSKYMVPAAVTWRGKRKPKIRRLQKTKLNIITGRLARSILNQYSFAQGAAGEKESIRKVDYEGGKFIARMGSTVPYAAIREFGGKIHHDNLFGKGIEAIIKIPARPYLRPAAEDSVQTISIMLQQRVSEFVEAAIVRGRKK